MRFCEKCRVRVVGTASRCPLCQSDLTVLAGEEPDVFPVIPTLYRQHNLFFKILILLSVAAAVICAAINLMLPENGWWSLFVFAGIGCAWVSLAIAVRKRHNIPKVVLYQVVVVSVLTWLWDCLTGWRGWSVNFVLPGACVVAMVVLAVAAKLIELNVGSVIFYFTLAAFFGIIPLAFWAAGLVTVPLPSLLCAAGSIISLAALFLFRWDDVLSELKRRFHL